jgi:two-component system, OmpR family, response regulator
VQDEQKFANEMGSALERIGYLVRLASMAEAHATREGDASLLILGRLLFGVDCLPSLKLLCSENIKFPVVSILSSVDEKVRGLKAGAGDYLAKHSRWSSLAHALRRCGATKIELGPREFGLLEYFLRRPVQVITRAMLLRSMISRSRLT